MNRTPSLRTIRRPDVNLAIDLDDSRWKSMTTLGNKAFHTQDFDSARRHYRLAMLEALALLTGVKHRTFAESALPAAIIVVSALNIAKNWVRLGDPRHGVAEIQRAIAHLLEVLQDESAPNLLKDSCAQHLPRALSELVALKNDDMEAAQQISEDVESAQRSVFAYLQSSSPTH